MSVGIYVCDSCFKYFPTIEEYTDLSGLYFPCIGCGGESKHHIPGHEWHVQRIIKHMIKGLRLADAVVARIERTAFKAVKT